MVRKVDRGCAFVPLVAAGFEFAEKRDSPQLMVTKQLQQLLARGAVVEQPAL
jgi:hypothetical protein